MIFTLEADTTNTLLQVWLPIIVQILGTAGVIFGGAGFWDYLSKKAQKKQEEKEKKDGVSGKMDNLSDKFDLVSEDMQVMKQDMRAMKEDIQGLRKDVLLLQKANEETIKYRELRDANDKKALIAQHAVIESLKGLLRDRLLEVYKQCMAKGYYTKEERETYGELFTCYESEPFDGNGVMHQLRPIMQALPWTAEDAEKEAG